MNELFGFILLKDFNSIIDFLKKWAQSMKEEKN